MIQAKAFTPDALAEIPDLQTLDIILIDDPSRNPAQVTAQSLPDLELTLLTRLRIGNLAELHSRTLRPAVLSNLPNLRELSLTVSPKAYETQRIASFTIRPDLLANNPDLNTLEVRQGTGQRMKTTIFEDSFNGNPNLSSLTLYTHETDSHVNALANLILLNTLTIIGQPEGTGPTLRLDPRAPLHSRIFHGYETPVGFQIPETDN